MKRNDDKKRERGLSPFACRGRRALAYVTSATRGDAVQARVLLWTDSDAATKLSGGLFEETHWAYGVSSALAK